MLPEVSIRRGPSRCAALAVVFVLSCLITATRPAAAQVREITISGPPQCSECRITLDRVATIGAVTDEHLYSQLSLLVRGPGPAYYVANGYTPGTILAYDSTGTLFNTIGDLGRGPGEIPASGSLISVSPEDSLYVAGNGRITVFSTSNGNAARSWNPGVGIWNLVSLRGGVTAMALAPNARKETVRLVNQDGSVRASLYYEGLLEHRDQLAQRIHVAGDTLLLVSSTGRYRVSAFDRGGHSKWTIEREVDWFAPYARQPANAPILAPSLPDIVGAWVESNRYLWILLERSPVNWRAVEPRTDPDKLDFSALLGSHIEVIDLQAAQVIASERLHLLLPAAAGQPFLYTFRQAVNGEVVFDVWRVQLAHPLQRR